MIGDPESYEEPDDINVDDDSDDSKRASVLSISYSNTGSEAEPDADRDADHDPENTSFGGKHHRRGSDSASNSRVFDKEERDHLSQENSPAASPMMKSSHPHARSHRMFAVQGNDHGLGPGRDGPAFDFATGLEHSEGSNSDNGTPNDSPASSSPGTPTGVAPPLPHSLLKPDETAGTSTVPSDGDASGHPPQPHHPTAKSGADGDDLNHSRNSSVASSSPSSINSAQSNVSAHSNDSRNPKDELPKPRSQSRHERPSSRPRSRDLPAVRFVSTNSSSSSVSSSSSSVSSSSSSVSSSSFAS